MHSAAFGAALPPNPDSGQSRTDARVTYPLSIFFLCFQSSIRYTDTCIVIAQQWEKGSAKATFPNVFAYEYNRKKFENLAKFDSKTSFRTKTRRVVVEAVDDPADEAASSERSVSPELTSTHTEEQTVLAPPKVIQNEEDDSSDDPVNEVEPISGTDETTPAIFIDSSTVSNDATLGDRSPLSFDAVWKSDDLAEDDYSAFDLTQIIVDIHDDPDCIVLEIREDDEIERSPVRDSIIARVSKERDLDDVPESDHEQSADEELPPESEEAGTRDDEPFECDINENLIVKEARIEDKVEIVVDHNDNNVEITSEPVKHSGEPAPAELSPSKLKRHDFRRISDSSRSSYDESDGIDSEPSYASIDKCIQAAVS